MFNISLQVVILYNVYLLTQLSVIGGGKAFLFLFSSKTEKRKKKMALAVFGIAQWTALLR